MPEATTPRRYTAFISYRHADNVEEGQRWAEWLHQLLETYEVPASLAGKLNDRGQPIPSTLFPVFRDEAELPANAELASPIRLALENSATLIVICSPRAVESRFVAEEIRLFKEMGRAERVLALIVDGEPNAADGGKTAQGIQPAQECFPEPLRYGLPRPDGTIDWTARTEPIAADVRPGGRALPGWTGSNFYREALEKAGGRSTAEIRRLQREYAARLQLARLKLISGVLGIALGRLTSRDADYRARKLRRLATVFGSLALLALIAGAIAFWQRGEAQHQRLVAEENARLAEANKLEAQANERLARASELQAKKSEQTAITSLANSDFREGTHLLGKPETTAEGLALLARSARLGHHPGAEARLWTFMQQRAFWLEVPPAPAPPTPLPVPIASAKIPARFATATIKGRRYPVAWYAESADRQRCVTIANGSIADDTQNIHHFRVWRVDGTPLTAWLEVSNPEQKDVRTLSSAHLSADGRLVAVVANPWREPEYLEVWDVSRAAPVGKTIEATGTTPNVQGAAFTQVEFVKAAAQPPGYTQLLLASSRGDASVYGVSTEAEGDLILRGLCQHATPVARATVDPAAEWLTSAAEDRQILVCELKENTHLGFPFTAPAAVQSLARTAPDTVQVQLAQGGTRAYRLVPPITIPLPPGLQMPPGKAEPEESRDGGPNEIHLSPAGAILATSPGGLRARLVQQQELALVSGPDTAAVPRWQYATSAPILWARFAGERWLLVQTTVYTTEIVECATGRRVLPPVDEKTLFAPEQIPTKPYPSSLSPDGERLLTRSFMWDPPNVAYFWFTMWETATGLPILDRMRIIDDSIDNQPNRAELSPAGDFLLLGTVSDQPAPPRAAIQLIPPPALRPLLPDYAEAIGALRVDPSGGFAPIENPLQRVEAFRKARP